MAFLFKLETVDGMAAEPPTLMSAVPNWRSGDAIPLGHKTLRVVGIRDDTGARKVHRRVIDASSFPGAVTPGNGRKRGHSRVASVVWRLARTM
jgi:hypothetical protein